MELMEFNPSLSQPSFNFKSCEAKLGLISSVKQVNDISSSLL